MFNITVEFNTLKLSKKEVPLHINNNNITLQWLVYFVNDSN